MFPLSTRFVFPEATANRSSEGANYKHHNPCSTTIVSRCYCQSCDFGQKHSKAFGLNVNCSTMLEFSIHCCSERHCIYRTITSCPTSLPIHTLKATVWEICIWGMWPWVTFSGACSGKVARLLSTCAYIASGGSFILSTLLTSKEKHAYPVCYIFCCHYMQIYICSQPVHL